MNYELIFRFLIEFLIMTFDESPRRCKVEWFRGEELIVGTNYIYPDSQSAMSVGFFWLVRYQDTIPEVTCVFDREVA